MCSGGIFDYADKKDRLAEVELELAEPAVWEDPERAQALGRERSSLETIVQTIDGLALGVSDAEELLAMAVAEAIKRRPMRWRQILISYSLNSSDLSFGVCSRVKWIPIMLT